MIVAFQSNPSPRPVARLEVSVMEITLKRFAAVVEFVEFVEFDAWIICVADASSIQH